MERSGAEWSGAECNGAEWSGAEWNGSAEPITDSNNNKKVLVS
jgi:hypothetical protein